MLSPFFRWFYAYNVFVILYPFFHPPSGGHPISIFNFAGKRGRHGERGASLTFANRYAQKSPRVVESKKKRDVDGSRDLPLPSPFPPHYNVFFLNLDFNSVSPHFCVGLTVGWLTEKTRACNIRLFLFIVLFFFFYTEIFEIPRTKR